MKRTVLITCLLLAGVLWAAGEMSCDDDTGLTKKYAVIYNADGNVALSDGSAFEAFATADLYDITMTEKGVGGHYMGNAPALLPEGRYDYTVFTQAGANPANGDVKTHTGKFVWSGTEEKFIIDINGRVDINSIDVDGLISQVLEQIALLPTAINIEDINNKTNQLHGRFFKRVVQDPNHGKIYILGDANEVLTTQDYYSPDMNVNDPNSFVGEAY